MIVFGAVAIVLIMVSSASAVSSVNGASVIRAAKTMREAQSLPSKSEELISSDLEDSKSEELISSDLEELLEILDIDGFREFFTSNDFADIMKSDEIQRIINSKAYLRVYNHEATSDFLNSEIFQDFINSDEAQIYLDNYFGDDGDDTIPSEVQQVEVAVKMISPMPRVGVLSEGRESTDMVASSGGSAQSNNGFIKVLFQAILIALILWIPYAIDCLIGGFSISLEDASHYYKYTFDIYGAVITFLIEYLIHIGTALFFPLFFIILYMGAHGYGPFSIR